MKIQDNIIIVGTLTVVLMTAFSVSYFIFGIFLK